MKKTLLITLLTSSHVILFAQYRGGSNDVWAQASAINQNPLQNIYLGNVNDGQATVLVTNQNSWSSIYRGGLNDGVTISIAVNQNSLPSIYSGGVNDGFSILSAPGQNPLPSIYLGGLNDGFNSLLIAAQNPLNNIYRGGSNDGYAFAFTFANSLPIRLTDFKAQWRDKDAYLWWTVDMEDNNDHFEVERSTNGIDFVTAGIVQSLGNTQTIRRYDFTDKAISGNILYYRLKQVDKDGQSTHSAIVILKRDAPEFTLAVFPNPTNGAFTLQLNGISNFEKLQYQVYNLKGQLLQNNRIRAGNTLINLSQWSSGTYLVAILNENKIIHQLKIILLK